ncbi:hypothetical protein D4764_04G0000870 [Takifugu flavidus]|uniref:Ig-like domain-containing protein n=1 Tax=Takifugu flavidus TaxID=433684 RepID=A0A5C6N6L2_9TELE|nr:hypothetical protein D4764_04G0000870 [Takifugu flavidus]
MCDIIRVWRKFRSLKNCGGASPEPLIRIVDGGPDRALLQCEVKGAHPRPAVQWQDSSGRVLPAQETESEERDGRFYVTVRADVSRSDDYSCVVTQEEFCHQISSTTFVAIGDAAALLVPVRRDWTHLTGAALPGSSTRSGSMKSLRSVSGPDGPRISTHHEPGGRLELSNDDAVRRAPA